ncbi:MAG: hypothetical protein JW969_01635, partial [Spirochaetales bacterium]|nr:hypothetical protein [Spirochaetales bacterium]
MKPRIYIDTSVIGGCFDEEFKEWSEQLFEEFTSGLKFAVVSDLTLAELADAPEMDRKKHASIPETNYENIYLTEKAENLAEAYLNAGVVSPKYIVDAQHIAVATLNKVDSLV